MPISINHLRFIERWQNKCANTIVVYWKVHMAYTFRERVYVFEIVATAKMPILGEFIST